VKIKHTYFKTIWLAGLAILCAVALVGCGSKSTKTEPVVTGKTYEQCQAEGWVKDGYLRECDSLLFLHVLSECEWIGDTIPEPIRRDWISTLLVFNYLKKMAPSVSQLYWFQDVSINISSHITSIPAEIYDMPSIRSLTILGQDSLRSIPDLTHADSLSYFGIDQAASLDSLPSGLWLAPIETIYLQHAKHLNHLPGWLPKMKSLTYLNLTHDSLTSLPDNIGQVPLLKRFDFNDNEITDLPNWICDDRSTTVSLQGNKLCNLRDTIKSCLSWWDSTWTATQHCN